jgi:GDP-L-fucose synthase
MTIRELAKTTRDVVGLDAEIVWDVEKTGGQSSKIFDINLMQSYGLECPTSLRDGLTKVYAWFEQNFESEGKGPRL